MPIDVEQGWYSGLIGVVRSTWPELTAIHRSQSINRTNWENLVNSSRLSAPFCVIEMGTQEEEDWGRDNFTFRQPLSIYYVAATNASGALVSGNVYDVTQYTLNKAHSLRLALQTYTGSGFQLAADYPVINVSASNPANTVFYGLQAKYFSSQIYMRLLFGESNLDASISG